MKTKTGRARLAAAIVSMACLLLMTGCGKGLPAAAHDQLFQQSRFAEVIQLNLPNEDSRDFLRRICTTRYGGLTPLNIGSPLSGTNRYLLTYLTSNGFAEIKSAEIHGRYRDEPIKLFFYTNKLTSGLDVSDTGIHSEWDGTRYRWNVGKRVLKQITYLNRYEATPNGVRVEVYGVTFAYGIEWNAPGLANLDNSYEGKAQVYQDPSDGRWKVEDLQLTDHGYDDFLSLLGRQLPAFDENAPSGTSGCTQ